MRRLTYALDVIGVSAITVGVALQFGIGMAAIVGGVLGLLASASLDRRPK